MMALDAPAIRVPRAGRPEVAEGRGRGAGAEVLILEGSDGDEVLETALQGGLPEGVPFTKVLL